MSNIKLLLVDDHQVLIGGLKALLEKDQQIDVVGTASSGEKALAFLERHPVDVVVLDVSMPDMDGFEVAQHIKRQHPQTRIILLTMFGEGRFIQRALRMGIHGYILKEKSPETLITAIHTVYGRSTYFSPDLLALLEEKQLPDETDNPDVALTKRETEILCLMTSAPHLTTAMMAQQLNIAPDTVQTHIRNVKSKLGLSRSTELMKYALEKKLCG